jgi:catechol 2,3-dioxygenase-like lactoylglutathione lyase family enzyme
VLDHIGVPVRDIAATRSFYSAALAPLGLSARYDHDGVLAFGPPGPGRYQLWFYGKGSGPGGLHIALTATTRTQVHQFHAAALAAGGTDNGAPGPRPHYTPTYYGAFVRDPDGHNLEAVCHAAED